MKHDAQGNKKYISQWCYTKTKSRGGLRKTVRGVGQSWDRKGGQHLIFFFQSAPFRLDTQRCLHQKTYLPIHYTLPACRQRAYDLPLRCILTSRASPFANVRDRLLVKIPADTENRVGTIERVDIRDQTNKGRGTGNHSTSANSLSNRLGVHTGNQTRCGSCSRLVPSMNARLVFLLKYAYTLGLRHLVGTRGQAR